MDHFSQDTKLNYRDGNWYNQLVEEKVPNNNYNNNFMNNNKTNDDDWWESDFTYKNSSGNRVDSQGNVWKSEPVTKHAELKKLDPIALVPMNVPGYNNNNNNNYNNNYNNANNNYNNNHNNNYNNNHNNNYNNSYNNYEDDHYIQYKNNDLKKNDYKNNEHKNKNSDYINNDIPVHLSKRNDNNLAKNNNMVKTNDNYNSNYNNNYKRGKSMVFELGSDEIPVRFKIPFTTKYVRGFPLYSENYPIILSGIIDKEEYIQVIRGMNDTTRIALGKKRYSEGMAGFLGVTACLIILPAIPLIILENKKIEKLKKARQAYMDMINPQFARHGFQFKSFTENMRWEFVLEIIDHSIVSSEMQSVFLSKNDNVYNWDETENNKIRNKNRK